MASDEKRREVANELRRHAAYSSGSLGEWWQLLQDVVTGEVDFANPQETYRAIADLIDPEGPAVPSDERDTRIPYRLGTDQYCKFEGSDEYVHMGDLVTVDADMIFGRIERCGKLLGVEYNDEGFLNFVKLIYPYEDYGYYVAFDGAFHQAEAVTND